VIIQETSPLGSLKQTTAFVSLSTIVAPKTLKKNLWVQSLVCARESVVTVPVLKNTFRHTGGKCTGAEEHIQAHRW
jgi:hypothetical protein